MKFAPILFVCAAAASGCIGPWVSTIQGSGVPSTRRVESSPVNRITTNGAFDVEVRQGSKTELTLTGDDNLIKLAKFENVGGHLEVKIDGSYSTRLGLKLVAVVPELEGLEVSGSGSATVDGVNGDGLELKINGSGAIQAVGTVKSLNAAISGSGNIDVSQVEADAVSASISGSGSIDANAKESLSGSISGSGSIRYKGSPKVSKSINGSGSIDPM